MRTNTIKISLPVVIFLFAGCSLLGLSREEKTISYRDSGSVVLSRVAPLASSLNLEDSQMLGFLPMQQTSRVGHWLAINKTKRTVEIMDGDQSLVELSADGIDKLVPGKYEVIHKQKAPLWYAPEAYFTSRHLEVPQEGTKDRYLKGALGDFVVYFSPELPIHGSLISSDEIGGIRLSNADISRLYYSLDIGSAVEVK